MMTIMPAIVPTPKMNKIGESPARVVDGGQDEKGDCG